MSPDNTLTGKLDEIRAMQGKDPLPDPHKIQGFGPEDPPPPRLLETDPDVPREWLDPEVDFEQPKPVSKPKASPLIPQPKPVMPPAGVDLLTKVGLVVIDRLAAWKGREVTLSEPEEAKIRQVILLAIRREVDADLSAVSSKRPRRPRTAPVAPNGTDVQPQAPKRRGRPRGSLLQPRT